MLGEKGDKRKISETNDKIESLILHFQRTELNEEGH